jgi:quercetin dioxygenase-like cupin family protein
MGNLIHRDETPITDAGHGITRQVAVGNKMLLAVVTVQPGCSVPAHSHVHEQIGYVASGRAVFRTGDSERELGRGDMYTIPGGEVHSVTVISEEPGVFVDVFNPVREEYIV